MDKCKYYVKLVMGVLVAAALAGCTVQADLYWPGKSGTEQRRIVHDRQQGQSDLEYFEAWRADNAAQK